MPQEKPEGRSSGVWAELLGGVVLIALALGAVVVLHSLFPREPGTAPAVQQPRPAQTTPIKRAPDFGECDVDRQAAGESAIGLLRPDWLSQPLDEWCVLDAQGGQVVQRVRGTWEPCPVPPGSYKIRYRQCTYDGLDITLPQTIDVGQGELVRLKLLGGVKVEGPDWLQTPYQWGLVVGKKGYVQFVSGRWDTLLMPPGLYGVLVQQDSRSAAVLSIHKVGVAQSGLTTVKLDSGIDPVPARWAPIPRRVSVRDGKNREIQYTVGTFGKMYVPPGRYGLVVQPDTTDGLPVSYARNVEVKNGALTKVPIDSGIAVKASSWVPRPYAWYVVGSDGKDIQVCKDGWKALVVPPGEYDVCLQPQADGSMKMPYMKAVKVAPGRLVELSVDTGIEVRPASWMSPPARWLIYDAEGKEVVQSIRGRWGKVAAPPGKYLIAVKPEEYNKESVRFPDPIEVAGKHCTRVSLRSGIEPKPPAGARPPYRWAVVDAASGKEVVFVLGRWGSAIVPPGTYTISAQFEAPADGVAPVLIAEKVVVTKEKRTLAPVALPQEGE